MKKKIITIFIFILIITTALTVTGAMNLQKTWLVNDNNYSDANQNIVVNSPNLITINIVAKVYNVDDPDNLLGGAIKINDTIKGRYTYDLRVIDSNPDPNIGEYKYNSSSCGIKVKTNGFVFKTDPNNVYFQLSIINDYPDSYYLVDCYHVLSGCNLNLPNGLWVDFIFWQLYDDTGTALSTTDLPTTAPKLSNWNQSTSGFGLDIQGCNPTLFSIFRIQADVTKVTKSKARDVYFTEQPILIWLFERFPIIFSILRYLLKL